MPQSLANVPIHLVFSTYQRAPLLAPEIRAELHPYMMAVVRNIGCTAIQVGGVEDHIHICYGLGRTITMAQVAEKVKTSTTKWLKGKWPGCRDFAWLAGYATYGVGTHGVDDVVAYIQGQEEHHRHESFEEEYKRILDEAGIEYDPRYMFE